MSEYKVFDVNFMDCVYGARKLEVMVTATDDPQIDRETALQKALFYRGGEPMFNVKVVEKFKVMGP